MKVAVLGTGMVGQTIATKLASMQHSVMIGSRDRNNPKAKEWIGKVPKLSLGTFAEAAQFAEIIFICTLGTGTLPALKLAGEKSLASKILIDVSNPLDFSKNNQPSLFVCNTDSLAEQIQRIYPKTRVVKTLNTLNSKVMVNPSTLTGPHNLFLAGNDENAKQVVKAFLEDNFGWTPTSFIDLGDITGARSAEMLVMLWIRLWNTLQNPVFNYNIVTPT